MSMITNTNPNPIFLPFDTVPVEPSNDKGVSSTLSVSTHAIEDALAAVEALKGLFSVLADNYVDVDTDVFNRRYAGLQEMLQAHNYQAFTYLDIVRSNLELAKGCNEGAAQLSKQIAAASAAPATAKKEVV